MKSDIDPLEAAQARIRDLEATLSQKDARVTLKFGLSPQLGNIFGLLLSLEIVDVETIRQRMEICTDVKVAVHRLRKALKRHGLEVHSRRNLGYWFDSEAKARIRRILNDEPTGADADNVIAFPAQGDTPTDPAPAAVAGLIQP